MSYSTLSAPRIIDVTEFFHHNFTLDTAKNCFLAYFIAKRALKLWRHVRARGIYRSLRELYVSIAQVLPISLPLTPSSAETFSFCLRKAFGLLLSCRLCARKWRGKWSLRELRSIGNSYHKVRMWYATSPFQRKVVPWNGSSARWSKWTRRHLRKQITGKANYPAQFTVRNIFLLSSGFLAEQGVL